MTDAKTSSWQLVSWPQVRVNAGENLADGVRAQCRAAGTANNSRYLLQSKDRRVPSGWVLPHRKMNRKESSDNVWQQDGKQRREKLSLWVSHERISTMSRTNVTITGKKFHSAVQHLPQWPQGLSRLEINCSWSSISDNWINRLRSSHRNPPQKNQKQNKTKPKTYSMKMWRVLSYKTLTWISLV